MYKQLRNWEDKIPPTMELENNHKSYTMQWNLDSAQKGEFIKSWYMPTSLAGYTFHWKKDQEYRK